jgi:hypothetical protein
MRVGVERGERLDEQRHVAGDGPALRRAKVGRDVADGPGERGRLRRQAGPRPCGSHAEDRFDRDIRPRATGC